MKNLKLFFCLLLAMPLTLMAQSPISGDWKTTVPGDDGSMVPVKLSVADDGTYQVDFGMDGTVEIFGNSEVNDGKISVTDTKGERSCPDKEGVYKINIGADSFSMERISDPCEGRGGPDGKMEFTKL